LASDPVSPLYFPRSKALSPAEYRPLYDRSCRRLIGGLFVVSFTFHPTPKSAITQIHTSLTNTSLPSLTIM
jgi:hypothetical protein